jgi:predicted flap endonuclease-1-like 5' DNA nuclease
MHSSENKNAPWLGGWIIGAAAGLVAFGVLVVVGDFDLVPAAALGGGVALIAGLILGMPWGAGSARVNRAPAAVKTAPAVAQVGPPAPSSPTVPAHSAVEAAAQPAAFVSAPVATAMAETKPKAAPKPKAATKPKAAGPERLKEPRNGKADDLKEIEGIGPAMEKLVNGMGFYHFDQIANWSEADVAVVDGEMKSFKGRITRDRWVTQAKIIVSEGLEAFRARAKTNNY